MSAAHWRKAMNFGAPSRNWSGGRPSSGRATAAPRATTASAATAPVAGLLQSWRHVGWRHVLVLAAVLVYPWVVTPFFAYQIGGQALTLGLIALSLTFLAGYGGMLSLAQMTVAGIAGYIVAILGVSGSPEISLGWPWWLVVVLAVAGGTLAATLIGWLSVRTEGIYTIMITLAIGMAFFYLAQQNYAIFNGFQGFQKVVPPEVLGVDWRAPVPYYYLALFWALAGYFFVKYLIRAPFGIALQGVRDNARRMSALGYSPVAHRVAAYAVAGVIASVGGVLLVWYNGLITPGSVGTSWMINILIVAVLGGMRHPVGPFIGAIVFVLLQNFAIDLIDRERFNLVIGLVFLVIVLFSPDGLIGWWDMSRDWARRRMADAGANVRGRGIRGANEWRSVGVSQARPAGRP